MENTKDVQRKRGEEFAFLQGAEAMYGPGNNDEERETVPIY